MPNQSITREALSHWQIDYNTVRPHSGLGNLTPAAYAKASAPNTQRNGALHSIGGFAPHFVASPSQQDLNQLPRPIENSM